MVLKIKDLEITSRAARLPPVKCSHCDSSSIIEIKTLRKTKGKGQKALEAAAAEVFARNLADAKALNAKLGAELLADPICTCAKRLSTGRGDDGGHPLSTSWSRDEKRGGMMPGRPQHYHGCPARKRDDERRLQQLEEQE